jgi:hypothetical protein
MSAPLVPVEGGWKWAHWREPVADEAPRELTLATLEEMLNRLAGLTLHRLDGRGKCDDCGHESEARFAVGRFTLCRGCATRRLRAGERVEA